MPINKAKRVGVVAITLVIVIYLGIVLLLALAQRRILYPVANRGAPPLMIAPPGYMLTNVRTSDGLSIKCLYRPASTGMPTLLIFHGNGDTVMGSAVIAAPLIELGYGAMLAEFRGYGGNPGSPDEAGLYRDGDAARRFLDDQGIVANKIVVVGYSLGSGIASEIASQAPVGALVLISPFTSVPDAAGQHFPWLPTRLLMRDRFATIERLGSIHAPLLLIHGEADQIVYPSNSRILAKSRPDATLRIVPGFGHEIAFRPQAAKIISDWLRTERL